MTSPLLKKARDNRLAALAALSNRATYKTGNDSNIFSLDDARKRRQIAAPQHVVFASRRAA